MMVQAAKVKINGKNMTIFPKERVVFYTSQKTSLGFILLTYIVYQENNAMSRLHSVTNNGEIYIFELQH